MRKNLQKSANRLCEVALPHPGILDKELFDRHFDLRCYAPSAELAPFVVHIFTQRVKRPSETYRPLEILSGPNMYLFITASGAFIHTVTSGAFEYNTKEPVVVGVKFRPGGLRPFLGKPVASVDLADALVEMFPELNEHFCRAVVTGNDSEIVRRIEALLLSKKPQHDKNIVVVEKIISMLDQGDFSSVESLARAVNRSQRSLQLLFQNSVGIGPKWVIARKRLLTAACRMQHKDHPRWIEIAAELGYSSQSHFSREFKKVVGVSPSQYLKRL